MNKLGWFLAILFVVCVIAIPFTYIIMEPWRATIGDFFGGLRDSVMIAFTSFAGMFTSLPYWPLIAVGIAFFVGVLVDRKAHAIYYGLRRRMSGDALADTGMPLQSQPVVPQIVATPPEQKKEAAS